LCPENKEYLVGDSKVPYFIENKLISNEHILNLANAHLKGSSLYVTGIKIGTGNHINLFIDGDDGVTIKDCVDLSRAIEGRLDRDKEDFALDVSSHGATTPLALPRQYKKHIGRTLEIKLNDGEKAEGNLIAMDAAGIKIEFSVRENKPIGKGKITVVKQKEIPFIEIKETKIKLKY
jgi:ribosome maturation factor RimP